MLKHPYNIHTYAAAQGGQQAFPDSKIIPVLMGAAGLVGILKMDGSKKKRRSGSISSATKNTQLLSSKTRRPSVSTSKQKRKETTASSRPKME